MSYSENGIFNVLDPWYTGSVRGMLAGGSVSTLDAEINAQILQAAIWAAQNENTLGTGCSSTGNARAATILFPGNDSIPPPIGSGPMPNDGRVYCVAIPQGAMQTAAIIINCGTPLHFLGTGNITLQMVPNRSNVLGDIFSILTSGDNTFGDNTGGMTFEDITFTFDVSGYTSDYSTFAAIH